MTRQASITDATKRLQRYLRQLSYHAPSVSAPPIDGIFERDTKRALMEFQSLYGLPVTGIADRATWELLYDAYRASLNEHAPPVAVSLFPFSPKKQTLTVGERDFVVAVLQYMLGELSTLYSDAMQIEITGIYDDATGSAVLEFQKKNGLLETGVVDLNTWNAIADRYNRLFFEDSYQ